MTDFKGVFARVFHNRKHTAQYAVISSPDGAGYILTRSAPMECPQTIDTFLIDRYGGSWKACREAAAARAEQLAKEER